MVTKLKIIFLKVFSKGILLCCSERKENSEKYKLNPENPGSKKQQFFPDFAFKLETIDHLINPSETLPVEPSQTYEV